MYKFCECCGQEIPAVHQHNRKKCVHCLMFNRGIRDELNRCKAKIRKLNVNPYPANSIKEDSIISCLKSHGKIIQTAGRLISVRGHGGSTFADLKDQSGTIQLFFSDNKLSKKSIQLLSLLDIGDFIDVTGKVDKTKAGQITIFVTDFTLLTKSIRPIPQSFYGLKDVETKLRKRYLDFSSTWSIPSNFS